MAMTAENCAAKYGVTRGAGRLRAPEPAARRPRVEQVGWPKTMSPGRSENAEGGEGRRRRRAPASRRRRSNVLAKLTPAFKKDGTVTAGNASGIVDGGAALILASPEAVDRHHLQPIGRLVAWASTGVEPSLMGMGPAPATRKVLAQAGLSLDDIDLIEVNEAFAGQYLAVEKDLGLNRDKVNVNGGAIALGHPLGMTGTRLLLTLCWSFGAVVNGAALPRRASAEARALPRLLKRCERTWSPTLNVRAPAAYAERRPEKPARGIIRRGTAAGVGAPPPLENDGNHNCRRARMRPDGIGNRAGVGRRRLQDHRSRSGRCGAAEGPWAHPEVLADGVAREKSRRTLARRRWPTSRGRPPSTR